MSREVINLVLSRDYQKKVLKSFSFWQRRKIKCKYCGKKFIDWDGPGYIGLNIGDICVCGTCSNKRLERPKETECFLVRIEYKDPEAAVYKNMKATDYPKFLLTYPDQALSKGLKISKINVEKQFESQEG